MTFGMFEASIASDAQNHVQEREAADKLAAAIYDVKDRFGGFLFASRDLEEYHDRLALVKSDVIKTIEPHLFPRTGIIARVLKPIRREFKAALDRRTAAGVQSDGIFSQPPSGATLTDAGGGVQAADDVSTGVLAPGESFNPSDTANRVGALDDTVDQDIDCTFEKSQQGKDLKPKGDFEAYKNKVDQGGPEKVRKNNFEKASVRNFVAWCREAGIKANAAALESYNPPDNIYFAITSALHRQAEVPGMAAPPEAPGDYMGAINDPGSGSHTEYLEGMDGQPQGFDTTGIFGSRRNASGYTDQMFGPGMDPTPHGLVVGLPEGQVPEPKALKQNEGNQPHKDHDLSEGEKHYLRNIGYPQASRRKTAAPDYLSKADQALTDLLNQKAEEFQQTIAPLQQALQTVQQAEAEAAAANPLNVLPAPGTVNVMPGQQPSGPGAQPPGVDASAAGAPAGGGLGAPPDLGSLLAGTDGAPTPDAGAADPGAPPPAAAAQGALPPELQLQARRRRQAEREDSADDDWDDHYVDEEWQGKGNTKPSKGPNPKPPIGYHGSKRGGQGKGEARQAGQREADNYYDEYGHHSESPGQLMLDPDPMWTPGKNWGHQNPDDPHGLDASGAQQRYKERAKRRSPGQMPLAGKSHTAGGSVYDKWNHYQQQKPALMGGEPDYEEFASSYGVGPRALNKLKQQHSQGTTPDPTTYQRINQDKWSSKQASEAWPSAEEHFQQWAPQEVEAAGLTEVTPEQEHHLRNFHQQKFPALYRDAARKQAWSGWGFNIPTQHRVAGWQWDNRMNGYITTAADKFSCECGDEHETPNYHKCKCGRIWNSYVIGADDGKTAALEKVICREVPVRKNMMVASKKAEIEKYDGHEFYGSPTEPDYFGEGPGVNTDRRPDAPKQPPADWHRRDKGGNWTRRAAREYVWWCREAGLEPRNRRNMMRYESAIHDITKTGPTPDEDGAEDDTPQMKAMPSDWHRRDQNQRWR